MNDLLVLFVDFLAVFWSPCSVWMFIAHIRNFHNNVNNQDKVDIWLHRKLAFRWLAAASVNLAWLLARLMS